MMRKEVVFMRFPIRGRFKWVLYESSIRGDGDQLGKHSLAISFRVLVYSKTINLKEIDDVEQEFSS
jgi:hypothetical protein